MRTHTFNGIQNIKVNSNANLTEEGGEGGIIKGAFQGEFGQTLVRQTEVLQAGLTLQAAACHTTHSCQATR